MKKFLLAAAGMAALAGSACSSAPECTAEMLTQKGQEMATALQEALTRDPAKATEFAATVQEVSTRFQGATTSNEACKAYDDAIAAIKS